MDEWSLKAVDELSGDACRWELNVERSCLSPRDTACVLGLNALVCGGMASSGETVGVTKATIANIIWYGVTTNERDWAWARLCICAA